MTPKGKETWSNRNNFRLAPLMKLFTVKAQYQDTLSLSSGTSVVVLEQITENAVQSIATVIAAISRYYKAAPTIVETNPST